MREWDEVKAEIRKTKLDRETAKSLVKMMKVRIESIKFLKKENFSSLVIEGYYEILKEAMTALMSLDGYKTLSHEALIGYLKENYKEFSESEIRLIDDLRKLRNKIAYKGFFVTSDYLERNQKDINSIIEKLKKILEKRI